MTRMSAPIGVFDSGVGGLTVLKYLSEQFPHQSWIYLGDTARLPYGTKSGPTIKTYTEENLAFLSDFNCRAFIIACNSASTQFLANEFHNRPVYKVIQPGAKQALKETKNQKIGIIGTKATISSKVYETELAGLGFKGKTFSNACPLFVPLVEEGLFDDPVTDLIVDRYLKPLKDNQIDTLILGCTHYPLLKDSINRYFENSVKLVSSEIELGLSLKNLITEDQTQVAENGKIKIYTTDRVEFINNLALRILNNSQRSIEFKNLGTGP